MRKSSRARTKVFSVTDFALGLLYDIDYKKDDSGTVYTVRQVECTLSATTAVIIITHQVLISCGSRLRSRWSFAARCCSYIYKLIHAIPLM